MFLQTNMSLSFIKVPIRIGEVCRLKFDFKLFSRVHCSRFAIFARSNMSTFRTLSVPIAIISCSQQPHYRLAVSFVTVITSRSNMKQTHQKNDSLQITVTLSRSYYNLVTALTLFSRASSYCIVAS